MSKLRFSVLPLLGVMLLPAACGGSDSTPTAQTTQKLHVRTLLASKASAARFGVARWHIISQKDPKAFVFDGSDPKGKVRFSLSIQDLGTQLRGTSYASKGSILVDKQSGEILSNTLGLRAARMTTAFQLDAAKGGVQYCGPALPLCIAAARTAIVWAAPRLLWLGKEIVKGYVTDYAAKKAIDAYQKSQTEANKKKMDDAEAARKNANAEADKALEDLKKKEEQEKQDAEKGKTEEPMASADEPTADVAALADQQDKLDDAAKSDAADDKTAADDAKKDADEAAMAAEDPNLSPEEKAAADQEVAQAQEEETSTAADAQESAEDAAGVDAADAAGDAAGDEPAVDDGAGDATADGGDDTLPEETDSTESLDEGTLDDTSSTDTSGDDGSGDTTGADESGGTCRKASCSKSSHLCACAHY